VSATSQEPSPTTSPTAEPKPADAIEGLEGFLFLAGGSHHPLLYARGERTISPEALKTFWRNQRRRRHALQRRQIPHRHVIAPDKHNACAPVFPEPVVCRPGQQALECCPELALADTVLYPLAELQRDFRRHCYRVDTHFTPFGAGVLCAAVLESLDEQEALAALRAHLDQSGNRKPGWQGDLGWRFTPARTEDKLHLLKPQPVQRHSNHLASGNNGIMDLYINQSSDPLPLGRVMLFGDSFGRDMAAILSVLARQVMYLRTPYLHLDLVDSARPDLVITESAERYLPSSLCDSTREHFLLMPFFREQTYSLSPADARAFSAFLSGREELT
jgi:hypothetical protein